MPKMRLAMNHAREILRLSREMIMSGRAIAKSLSLSTSTISKYLRQLEPVPWPLPDPGGEALLAQVLENARDWTLIGKVILNPLSWGDLTLCLKERWSGPEPEVSRGHSTTGRE